MRDLKWGRRRVIDARRRMRVLATVTLSVVSMLSDISWAEVAERRAGVCAPQRSRLGHEQSRCCVDVHGLSRSVLARPQGRLGPIDQHALLMALYRMLKPGGVIGVIDHYAVAGTDPWVSAKATHRIDPVVVRQDFLAAGFALEAESSVLRNAGDDYSLSMFDATVHGKTDRFVMRFRRP